MWGLVGDSYELLPTIGQSRATGQEQSQLQALACAWAGMFLPCETELIAKLIHRARQARWGLNITLAETRDELRYQELP